MSATNKEKYPQVWATFEKLIQEQEAIEAKTEGPIAQRQALYEEMDKLRAKVDELTEVIQSVQGTRYVEILNQKSALAKVMGGRRVSEPVQDTNEG